MRRLPQTLAASLPVTDVTQLSLGGESPVMAELTESERAWLASQIAAAAERVIAAQVWALLLQAPRK